MKQDLLEDLRRASGCEYLSDLRNSGRRAAVSHAAAALSAESYSLQQWLEAITYVTGQSQQFDDVRAAQRYLAGTPRKNRPGEG